MFRNVYIKDMNNGERKVITGPCGFSSIKEANNAAIAYGEPNLRAKYAFSERVPEESKFTLHQKNIILHNFTNLYPLGSEYTIEHDGFKGEIIGHYLTREGKKGVVLQHVDSRVVHVYGEKWLK